MNNLGGYPDGAQYDPRAPYNEVENPERELQVRIIRTISKLVTLKVRDYEIIDEGKDEDGDYYCDVDFSDCDIDGAIESQIDLTLPDGWENNDLDYYIE